MGHVRILGNVESVQRENGELSKMGKCIMGENV